jgi:hypothetical protein
LILKGDERDMTSRFTILLSMAGVLALGCSSPAEEGDAEDTERPAAPTRRPAFADQAQTPITPPPVAPVNEVAVTPVMTAPPVVNNGANGAAGSTGVTPTAGAIPKGAPGTGFVLTPVAGWVAGGTNEAGIQGSFYPLSDATGTPPGATTITPAPPADFSTAAGSTICVSGSASQVVGTPLDYARYWGGGVGFDLGDAGGELPVQPWARGNVVGFRYTLTGTAIPTSLRFIVTFQEGTGVNAGTYCKPIATTSGTPVTTMLGDGSIIASCWQAGGAPLPATALLRSIQWQVSTTDTAATPFNFCIENLTAITQ